ncbi:UNVERIFIED_CONTAM: hypothetical protein PYX00_002082 [Menopon gallinae]|uniref:Uncharacterized protein n=1 Tax=Menopon gallinae TaxID=328185 RepID=A0AAW2IGI9_9NEOP
MMVDDVVGIPSNHLSGSVRADSGGPGEVSGLCGTSMLSLRLERQCRPFWRTPCRTVTKSVSRHRASAGIITDTEKEDSTGNVPSESSTGAAGGLLGRLPRLDTLSSATPPSPHKVASNIRGFLANKFSNVIPDTDSLTTNKDKRLDKRALSCSCLDLL